MHMNVFHVSYVLCISIPQEVGVYEEIECAHNIQLQSNEAYGPLHMDGIHTSPNIVYGQLK